MLSAEQLDALTDPLVSLYQDFMESVIEDIARRIGSMKITNTAAWQLQRLVESGALYDDVIARLSSLTGETEEVLRSAFRDAGVKALRFDDAIYSAAGLHPIPLNLSPAMQDVLLAGLTKTRGAARNLTMTTANAAQQAFMDAADLAYMQVSSGAFDYNSAIRNAVEDVANNGLKVINFDGRRDQLDVAMRRTVLTGINQTVGALQIARADELGCDLVQTSAHAGARPEHEVWQGKVFSRSGQSDKYPDFVSSTGYGSVTGLCGVNCRHSFFPFFEGISEAAYSDAMLTAMETETVELNGKSITVYEATQKQRSIERKIRHWKRMANALEAAGLDNSAEIAKVKSWQATMRDFIKQTGLSRERVREQIR